ncbi:MAG TPA: P1 family peptidase, partial [Actinomycetota bacterium]
PPAVRPGPDQGYAACEAASEEIPEGSVGAGTGATVGKLRGREHAVKGGVGTSSAAEDGVTVGALVAVNAVGAVVDEEGAPIAGRLLEEGEEPSPPFGNTTLAVVATDARLSRERAHLLAIAAHDGLASAIRPAHTMWDGDTVFTLATGAVDAPQPLLERLAEDALADAVRRAVRLARGLAGIPPAGEEGGR